MRIWAGNGQQSPAPTPRPEETASTCRPTVRADSGCSFSREPRRGREVQRLIGLGATHQWDVLDEVPYVRWTTLADPEGNLFCVAEHPPVDQQRA
ncbi:VOC family protein [Paeniglutamicibacter sulfureus]|uniref:Glyoxalase-like domain-containing protein n=1 Tax=Paeniglutamicibacter sulfureus TaxID=43666 RepID=A0ABU2BJG5_9MICC|nr:VOC family protein [Paeniglutamicibacter sulfureus]MDR7358790.1 hypothetical protein [Paeniglutamicibacter sulfureus]